MLILVRQIRVRGEEIVDQRDVELETDALRVGSGKGQDLQLFGDAVAPEHAVLRPRPDGRLRVEGRGGNQVTAADRDVGRADLAIGEGARIGTHRVSPVEAPPGFDAAIEVRIDADAAQSVRDRLGDELALKLPGIRGYAYMLALLVIGLALALPLLGYYHDGAGEALETHGGPTDRLWSTGPLADAHHLPGIADDCNVCHVEPFERVRDGTCLGCHEATTVHFAPEHPLTGEFGGDCRACHKEHNEPPTLIVEDKRLCTDCHAQEQQRLVETAPAVGTTPVAAAPDDVPPATAFTADAHPEFLASLLRRDDQGWRVHRQRLDSGAVESSHLKFPHDVHLDAAKVSLADGPGSDDRALACTDCHTLEKEGEHFRPVTMETTCAGCHSLAFDDAQPDRQLPHGEPEALRTYLEEFYVRQAALQQRAGPTPPARRVPNTPETRRCEGEPLDCGVAWADQEMERLFTKAGCVSCHVVDRKADGDWQVQPVRLVEDWFPAARFDHRPHLNPGMDDDGATCTGCHRAQDSSDSQDVLMPGLETCAGCHAEDHRQSVALQCVDCHAFHRTGMAAMREE